jgi:hypothetical protein
LLGSAPAHASDFDGLGVIVGVVIGSLAAATTIFVAPAITTAVDTTDQTDYVTGMAWTTLGAGVGLAGTAAGTIGWIAHHNHINYETSMLLPTIGAVTGGVAASIIYGLVASSGDEEATGATGQPLLSTRARGAPVVSVPLLSVRF